MLFSRKESVYAKHIISYFQIMCVEKQKNTTEVVLSCKKFLERNMIQKT